MQVPSVISALSGGASELIQKAFLQLLYRQPTEMKFYNSQFLKNHFLLLQHQFLLSIFLSLLIENFNSFNKFSKYIFINNIIFLYSIIHLLSSSSSKTDIFVSWISPIPSFAFSGVTTFLPVFCSSSALAFLAIVAPSTAF